MDDLKPCPFCDGKDIEKLGFSPIYNTRPHIHCRDCGVDVYDVPTVIPIWHRNDSMVQAWNTRAERTTKMYRDEHGIWHCAACEHGADTITGSSGTLYSWNDSWAPNYCPHCGARVERREQ